MSPQEHEQWPEYAVCARCGASLGQDHRESPLGLRFCSDCFDGAIQEKARERAAELYLRGRCSNCGASLINGYRLNKLGVIYCIGCYNALAESAPKPAASEPPTPADAASREPARPKSGAILGATFWLSLGASHLLLFIDVLISSPARSFLPHSASFFRGVVCLDLLTLALLLAPERLLASRAQAVGTLLIATGFIILIGRALMGLIR